MYRVQLHARMLDLFVPIKVESYDSAMGSLLRPTSATAVAASTGLRVNLPSAPSHEDVLQDLRYEPAPHRALKELQQYDKYPPM